MVSPTTQPPTKTTTQRLLLRKPKLKDARLIFDSYASDPEIPHFMGWKVHTNPSETNAYLKSCISEWSDHSGFPYVVELLSDPGRPIGMIHMHSYPTRMGFGYVIARQYWNNGYATEALRYLVNWSLEQEHIYRTFAFCDAKNIASTRVMEKAGMVFEGVLRRFFIYPNISREPTDCRMYAKTR